MPTIETISDTHTNRHKNIKLKGANILIHAGDFTNYGEYKEVKNFLTWLKKLDNYDYKIFIAGNHDVTFEDKPDWILEEIANLDSNTIYLENSGTSILDLNIYGSPNCPIFNNWAFMNTSSELDKIYSQIPVDTDVLITHGPPFGIMDVNRFSMNCGSNEILKYNKNVALHVFGHIHEGYGVQKTGKTHYCNASTYKIAYDSMDINQSILFQLEDKKVINYTN